MVKGVKEGRRMTRPSASARLPRGSPRRSPVSPGRASRTMPSGPMSGRRRKGRRSMVMLYSVASFSRLAAPM